MSTKTIQKKPEKCECQGHKHCLNCHKQLRPTAVVYNGYCLRCWHMTSGEPGSGPAERLNGRKKCIVLGCENWSDQGMFEGNLCQPCHNFIAKGEDRYSQAYRNSLQIIARLLMSRTSLRRMEDMLISDLDPTSSIGRRGSYISEADLKRLTES
jgi:hypothetical protein